MQTPDFPVIEAGIVGLAIVREAEREEAVGETAERQLLPPQAGDGPDAYPDMADLTGQPRYKHATIVDDGIRPIVDWCGDYLKAQS